MQIQMFTVYDEKAKAYLQPFFLTATGLAIRSFTETVNDPKSAIGRHPADYTLFHIGSFDDSSCTFEARTPQSLGNGLEFVEDNRQIPMFPKEVNSNV